MALSFSSVEFQQMFPDNEACLDYLFAMRYPQPWCPKCGEPNRYHLQAGTSHYVCQCGGHQLSPKKGTIFEKSDTNLVKWFFAIFLMSRSRYGVPAIEIQRRCIVTYKTAWRMARRIRTLMLDNPPLRAGQSDSPFSENQMLLFTALRELDELNISTERRRQELNAEITILEEAVRIEKERNLRE